ncbi:MAG: 4Fe-4S ferredoxin [Spirochaetales bacterium]|nr:4Fe-4S ferredoxin [Spirochaetales bacterium]
MYASRNSAKCTKDCLCLFVCPTGATDTETGQIDAERCLDGCRLCVDACPSHAIFLVMSNYSEPAPKNSELAGKLLELCESKYQQEKAAEVIITNAESTPKKKLAEALRRSFRITAEDCAREAGYMLPQSEKVKKLLEKFAGINEDAKSALEGL